MNNKNILYIVGGILLVLLLAAGVYALAKRPGNAGNPAPSGGNNTTTATAPASIKSFTVIKPNFVVQGDNLSKVEIWAVPTGTGIKEADYKMLGTAVKQSGQGVGETWTLPIPAAPVLATEIFARGYDGSGSFVARMSLPYTGATALSKAIWGK